MPVQDYQQVLSSYYSCLMQHNQGIKFMAGAAKQLHPINLQCAHSKQTLEPLHHVHTKHIN